MIIPKPGSRSLFAAVSITMLAAASAAPVPFAQLPAPVQKGITAQVGGDGKLGTIDRDEEDGEVSFTFELTKAGKTRDYTVDENGTLTSVEVTLAETPLAVQKTVQAQIGQGSVESVDKSFEDGKVSYDVDFKNKAGAERSLTVMEDGKLDSIEVGMEETPPAVQATVAKESAGAQVKEIEKTFEDAAVIYEVTITRGGADRSIDVAESGKVESRQVLLTETPPPVQKTIQASVGPGKLLSIDQVFEAPKRKKGGGGMSYDVEAVKDGKSFSFSVGPKGAYLGAD